MCVAVGFLVLCCGAFRVVIVSTIVYFLKFSPGTPCHVSQGTVHNKAPSLTTGQTGSPPQPHQRRLKTGTVSASHFAWRGDIISSHGHVALQRNSPKYGGWNWDKLLPLSHRACVLVDTWRPIQRRFLETGELLYSVSASFGDARKHAHDQRMPPSAKQSLARLYT